MKYAIEILTTELHRLRSVIRQIEANEHMCMSAVPHDNYLDHEQEICQAIERLRGTKELAATDNQQPQLAIMPDCKICINRFAIYCESCDSALSNFKSA